MFVSESIAIIYKIPLYKVDQKPPSTTLSCKLQGIILSFFVGLYILSLNYSPQMNCNVSVVWKCNWRLVGIFARLNLGDYLCYSIFLIFFLLFLILVESKMKLQVINLLSYRSFNESADENREAHDCLMTEEVAFDNNRIVFQKN